MDGTIDRQTGWLPGPVLAACIVVSLVCATFVQAVSGQSVLRFTPSMMLERGQVEVKWFNNLYTQTSAFDAEGQRVKFDTRLSYFTSILQAQYGLSSRLNVGFDVMLKSVTSDQWTASPFEVLTFGNDQSSQTAVSLVGPRVRYAPFRSARLSLQGALLIPASSDMEGRESGKPFLEYDDPQIWLQAFYDYAIDRQYLVYLETGIFFRPDNTDGDASEWTLPLKAILNFYPTERWTVYGLTDYTVSSNDAYYFQAGLGLKRQVVRSLEVEILFTGFPIGRNRGGGKTFNLGVRWIRF